WNSTNNRVYCANSVSNSVTIIDGVTNAVITAIPVGDFPLALVWNSTNNRTYVTNYADNSISVIRGETGVEEVAGNQSSITRLEQNFPNPFTRATCIRYQIPNTGSQEQQVTLKVYDITGRLVRTLIDAKKKSGNCIAVWDTKDDRGEKVTNGVYFYRLSTNGFTEVRNLILIK
ncbi:T9SS type A sorting domain-containing protein, partial [candidate division WOR-3 bacterium]|nr:T9SS type A sorting domain-containing protein [candidate division WOR-3 bacterium]